MSFQRIVAWLALCIPIVEPLGGCAINPVPVSALPGPNKDPVTFQKDETACRIAAARAAYPAGTAPSGQQAGNAQSGSAQMAAAPGNVNAVWQAYFTGFGQCETAHGNLVQPVPWAVAYQLYLGFGYPLPYPGGYAPAYGPPPYPPAYGVPPAYGYP